jgi:hypothetical protein
VILCDPVTDLESELAEVRASATRDITAMEAMVVYVDACAVDDAAAEKRLVNVKMELTEDLADLHEAYKRNIQSLGGICSPI